MRYLVVGAGGTGGCLSALMTRGGKDVTLIARGDHLRAIQQKGLLLHSLAEGEITAAVGAVPAEAYQEVPDVVFLCVKTYSVVELLPFLRRVCGRSTMVIPVLNGVSAGESLARALPEALVQDGAVYVFADKVAPGEVALRLEKMRLVFGPLGQGQPEDRHLQVAADLEESGVAAKVSPQMEKELFAKLSYVSPFGGAGAYYGVSAGGIYSRPEARELFLALVGEVSAVAAAKGHDLGEIVAGHLDTLSKAPPQNTSSFQKDLQAGGNTEADALFFDMVRLGRSLRVPVPAYEKVSLKFGF